ncbi:MAG: hypothetical protein KBS95_02045 [Alistipes sp.]|nr:hypothetical protein [Candidatus Alistipes equi]
MNVKRLLLSITLILSFATLLAQNTVTLPTDDDIFITGKQKKSNKSINTLPKDDDVFNVSNKKNTQNDRRIWYEGEYNIGYGLSGRATFEGTKFGDMKMNRFIVETVQGVRITPYAFVGGGVSLQYAYRDWVEWDNKMVMLPIFANVKGLYPVSESFEPYVSLRLGYNVGLGKGDSFANGLYASFALGFHAGNHFNFNFGWEQVRYKYRDEITLIPTTVRAGSLFFKLGLRF